MLGASLVLLFQAPQMLLVGLFLELSTFRGHVFILLFILSSIQQVFVVY